MLAATQQINWRRTMKLRLSAVGKDALSLTTCRSVRSKVFSHGLQALREQHGLLGHAWLGNRRI
jgi:hypothetical protein